MIYGWYSHHQRGLQARSDPKAGSDSDSNGKEIKIDRSAENAQKSRCIVCTNTFWVTWRLKEIWRARPLTGCGERQ